MYALGLFFEFGWDNVRRERSEAAYWYTAAATRGFHSAFAALEALPETSILRSAFASALHDARGAAIRAQRRADHCLEWDAYVESALDSLQRPASPSSPTGLAFLRRSLHSSNAAVSRESSSTRRSGPARAPASSDSAQLSSVGGAAVRAGAELASRAHVDLRGVLQSAEAQGRELALTIAPSALLGLDVPPEVRQLYATAASAAGATAGTIMTAAGVVAPVAVPALLAIYAVCAAVYREYARHADVLDRELPRLDTRVSDIEAALRRIAALGVLTERFVPFGLLEMLCEARELCATSLPPGAAFQHRAWRFIRNGLSSKAALFACMHQRLSQARGDLHFILQVHTFEFQHDVAQRAYLERQAILQGLASVEAWAERFQRSSQDDENHRQAVLVEMRLQLRTIATRIDVVDTRLEALAGDLQALLRRAGEQGGSAR